MSIHLAPLSEALALAITDHALLRWMGRAHGIDVDTWRALLREEAEAALAAFDGTEATYGPAFLVTADGSLVTYVGEGRRVMRPGQGAVAIPCPIR